MESEIEPSLSPKAEEPFHEAPSFLNALLAGGVAGIVVDIALFPIDTVKTRLQSELGFWRAGGFRGIYKGLAPAAAGSGPTAALFFCSYEACKKILSNASGKANSPYVHMAAASCGELLACLIRVPVEIAKQRKQVLGSRPNMSSLKILYQAYKNEGLVNGLYRGFGTTIMREIPFSLIQFPLWEFFKTKWTPVTGLESSPLTVAFCGALSGGIAAGITTPLDVAKTRIMLREQEGTRKAWRTVRVIRSLYRERGVRGIFAGVVPRVVWMTLGGAVFFGFFDLTMRILNSETNKKD